MMRNSRLLLLPAMLLPIVRWFICLIVLLLAIPAVAAERILALTPAACEMMYAMGAGDELVGASEYCNFPEAAKRLPRVANYRQLYVEAALRQKPTLVIVLHADLPGLEVLKASGVRVFTTNPTRVTGVFDDMLRLGELSGHQKQAEKVVDALRKRLKLLQRSSARRKPRVFYEIWHDPLITAGGSSLINDVLDEMHLKNVFGELPLEGPKISVEAVLLARPEMIILPDDSRVAARKRFWHKWFGGKSLCFVVADADLLHRPGPRLVQGMEQLQAALKEKSCD